MLKKIKIYLSLFIFILPLACQTLSYSRSTSLISKPLVIEKDELFIPYKLNSVLVLPFESPSHLDIAHEVLQNAAQKIIEIADRDTSLHVLNVSNDSELIKKRIDNLLEQPISHAERAQILANEFHAEAVIWGIIGSYKEIWEYDKSKSRQTEGEVSFRMIIYDPKENVIPWTAYYRKKNQPLSEDLFQLQTVFDDGILFKPAFTLLVDGLTSALRALESERKHSIIKDINN